MGKAMTSLLLLTVATGAPTEESLPSAAKIAAAKLVEDFGVFRRDLEEGHPGLYRYTPKAKMDRLLDEAKGAIRRPMSAVEFLRILAPLVAAVRCGHTSLQPPADLMRQVEEELFPCQVRVIDGRVYVFRDFATVDQMLAGKEILAINGIPIQKILAAMLEAMPGDAHSATTRPYRIGHEPGFERLLYPLLGIRSPFDTTYRQDAGGAEKTARVIGLSREKIQDRLRSRSALGPTPMHSADLDFLDEGKIAVLRIYGFGGFAGTLQPLGKFIDKAFEQILDKGSMSLIIDVRNNDGGAHELAEQLFAHLVDKPFLYYQDLVLNALTFSFLPYAKPSKPIPADAVRKGPDSKYHHITQANWGTQQPRAPHFAGQVYVFMNGGSFSSTCEFLAAVRSRKRAVFIGEESGGSYSGNTSGLKYDITLPSSKLVLRLPTVGYYMAINSHQPLDRGVLPDHAVRYSIEELLEGVDKEMQLALDLAREMRPPARGAK
jgi:hypothetical protein